MHIYKKTLAAVAVAALLVGCGGSDTKPQEDDKKPVWAYSGDFSKLKKGNEVAIASFRVLFITDGRKSEVAADSGRWGSTGKTSSRATVQTLLTGVDADLMQKITDTAYADFNNSLKAKGFTVLPMEQVVANKAFKKIDNRENGSLGTISGSMKKVLSNDSSGLMGYPTYSPKGLPLLDGSFFCSQTQALFVNMCLPKVADSLGMTVLHVSYVIDFSSFESSSKTGMGYSSNSVYSSAKVSTGQNLHLRPSYTGMHAYSKQGKLGAVYLVDNNRFKGAGAFGESVEATSGADQAASALSSTLGFLSGLSGGKTSTATRVTYEMQAEPAIYQSMVDEILSASNQELVDNLEYFRDKK